MPSSTFKTRGDADETPIVICQNKKVTLTIQLA